MYRIVADKINSDIQEQKLVNTLPRQEVLAEMYGVGRSTIREALRQLDEQGIIEVRQGAVTRVIGMKKSLTVQPGLESLIGISEIIRQAGHKPGTSYIRVRRTVSSNFFFPVFQGKSVVVIERVRTADDVPIIFSVDVIADRGWSLEEVETELRQGSLLDLLHASGDLIEFSELSFRVQAADPVLGERLNLEKDQPVIFFEEIVYNGANEVINCSNDYYHPRYTSFRVVRQANRRQ
ncbi:GntR family transcriptional regulator [Paenibacillus alginolyticus]|uniref:GntR family transcriptional regulator n=1 Tax=Paenibacillus alginolyticus TaxID=59839 RepID=UPI001564505F|nr:GntR family transcriptional regulator [Paenibacillus frigoriresistens]